MNHLLNIAVTGAGIFAFLGLALGIPKTVRMVLDYRARSKDQRLTVALSEVDEANRRTAVASAAHASHMRVCPMIEPLPKENR